MESKDIFLIATTLVLAGVVFTIFLYGVYKFYLFLMFIKSKQDENFINKVDLRDDRNIEYERLHETE